MKLDFDRILRWGAFLASSIPIVVQGLTEVAHAVTSIAAALKNAHHAIVVNGAPAPPTSSDGEGGAS